MSFLEILRFRPQVSLAQEALKKPWSTQLQGNLWKALQKLEGTLEENLKETLAQNILRKLEGSFKESLRYVTSR
jgi:hypothetical protein